MAVNQHALYSPLVVILKAAPFTPFPLCCGGAGVLAGRGEGARGEAGRGVRRLAGGGGERQASRLMPPAPREEFGLSLKFSASLWREILCWENRRKTFKNLLLRNKKKIVYKQIQDGNTKCTKSGLYTNGKILIL